jgi:hypothetical protein
MLTDAEKKLRKFARAIMTRWPNGGAGAEWIHTSARLYGLIEPTRVTESCGEGCTCATFPTTCWRLTDVLKGPATVEALEAELRAADVRASLDDWRTARTLLLAGCAITPEPGGRFAVVHVASGDKLASAPTVRDALNIASRSLGHL